MDVAVPVSMNHTIRSILLLLPLAFLCFIPTASILAQPKMSVPTARYTVEQKQEIIHLRGGSFDNKAISFSINLPAPSDAEIENLRTKNLTDNIPLQIGIGRALDPAQQQALTERDIEWETVEGGFIGRLKISSLDASALRALLIFNQIDGNTEIRFYGEGDPETIYGPFSKKDLVPGYTEAESEFGLWSPVLEGDTIGIEIFTPEIPTLEFRIESISHLLYSPMQSKAEDFLKLTGIGASGTCNLDVVCYPNWSLESDAVAKLIYQKDGSSYLCTGSLLNDTDNSTWIPYLMTANHCISSQTVASTLTSYWFYTSSACNSGTLSSSSQQLPGGATLLATGYTNDYTMLQLNNTPPSGVAFLGWRTSSLASGSAVTGIHHPSGDLQKISFGTSQGFANVRGTNSHIEVVWDSGTTEGGSSGSALLDNNKLFVGQLTGGYAACGIYQSEPDYYGRFDQYYAAVSSWLSVTPPADDNYEDNDSYLSAFDLSSYENTWLSSVDGLGIQLDDDYYKITIDPGYEHLIIDLTFTDANGDINLSLLNTSGATIATSLTTTDNEQIDTTVPSAGNYYLKIFNANAGNEYNLRWITQSTIPNGCYPTAVTLTDVTFSAGSTYIVSSEDLIDTSGTVIVENASNLSLTAPNSITLNPGFHAESGSQFIANIGAVSCP